MFSLVLWHQIHTVERMSPLTYCFCPVGACASLMLPVTPCSISVIVLFQ